MLNELLKRLHEENKAPNESKSNNDLKASSEDHQVPFYSEESIKRSNMNPLFPVPLNEDVMIFPEFVTEREHSNLIDLVDLIKPGILSSGEGTITKLGRDILSVGGTVTPNGLIPSRPIPKWLEDLSNELKALSLPHTDYAVNHLLVNRYPFGVGIFCHRDGPAYYPVVCIISLGSDVVFDFTREVKHKDAGQTLSILVPRRSLFVFRGEFYHEWMHGIAPEHQTPHYASRCVNPPKEESVAFGPRVSMTLRHVPLVQS
eukprot:GHVH01003616.1.p1 GENE.GHVH01003616.1~~GHVH01003616.1.p1  ORF type:complete len:259 (-),score=34.23 GHVH01003616.1:274-1050(-)